MINLFISGGSNEWESTPAFFERSRCLTEYILPEYKEKFGDLSDENIEAIKKFPCVFTNEQGHKKDAYIGKINDVVIRQTNVKIDYELTGEVIRFDDFVNLSELLDLGRWELNRTHWTIKKINIEELRPYFSTNIAKKPSVFLSYSWSPPENQKKVFDLNTKLTADGINTVYDLSHLRPGQDVNFFMEQSLTRHDIDYVLLICNQDYAEKSDARRGGVGREAEYIISELSSNPLQTRIIPIVFETNDKGEPYLPKFLKTRYFIDLTAESGYEELVKAILTSP